MTNQLFTAGQPGEIHWNHDNWIFLDMGFAQQGNKSCGLLFGDKEPQHLNFGQAGQEIIEELVKHTSPVNLVIEAPLSVCFDSNGSPKGRKIEQKEGENSRYWYLQGACPIMVGAMYLLHNIQREIKQQTVKYPIRLFEGFVSFKNQKSSHKEDVCSLRESVKDSSKREIWSENDLKIHEKDNIHSAFLIMGLNFGVPTVIKPV